MCQHCMNRREFGALAAAGVVGSMAGLSSAVAADPLTVEAWDPDQPPVVTGRPLRIQPVLAYQVMTPRPKTSWRSWSDIINPCLPMCRSQQDVEVQGAWKRRIPEAAGRQGRPLETGPGPVPARLSHRLGPAADRQLSL